MFSPRELSFFEKLFEMESGYVLDFSRDGLKNFIRDSVNLDVFTVDYLNYVKRRFGTDSMSNVLKYFWETEDFNKTLKLISDLVDYYESEYYGEENKVAEAKIILNRYYDSVKVKDDFSDEKRIIDLINEINHIINERQPVFALDKLHTLTHSIFRHICDSHNISYTKHVGIDSIFKKYVQFLEKNNFIEILNDVELLRKYVNHCKKRNIDIIVMKVMSQKKFSIALDDLEDTEILGYDCMAGDNVSYLIEVFEDDNIQSFDNIKKLLNQNGLLNSYEEVENFIQIRNELLQQGLNLEDYWEAIPVKLSLIDYNSI